MPNWRILVALDQLLCTPDARRQGATVRRAAGRPLECIVRPLHGKDESERRSWRPHELEGVALDAAVAKAIADEPGADYSTSCHHGGRLIERFHISLAPPQSRVHRTGGLHPGWGESGMWTCTSWAMRKADGGRALGYHATSPLVAAMRLIVACNPSRAA